MPLGLCSSCNCHIRPTDASCPHCGAAIRSKKRRVGAGTLLVAGLSSLGVAANTTGCGDDETSTTATTMNSTVSAYGVGPSTTTGGGATASGGNGGQGGTNAVSTVSAYGVGPSTSTGAIGGTDASGGNGAGGDGGAGGS